MIFSMFTAFSWLFFIIASLIIIPLIITLRHYKQTRIEDYLIQAAIWLNGMISAYFASIRASNLEHLVIYDIGTNFTYILFNYFFFIHAIRLRWDKIPKVLTSVFSVFTLILLYFILNYQLITEPETQNLWLINMKMVPGRMFEGAFVTSNGTILLSRAYFFLGHIYILFMTTVFIYSYLTADLVFGADEIKRWKNLWIILIIIWVLRPLDAMFHLLGFLGIQSSYCSNINITWKYNFGCVFNKNTRGISFERISSNSSSKVI